MFLGSGINAAMQKANYPEMKHPQFSCSSSGAPINNVEVKNIKSAGCCDSLAQLQRKFLQHLDHVARSLHFVANDKKGPSLSHRLFLGRSPSVLLGVRYILKFVDFESFE